MFVCLTETGTQLQDDEENVVGDKGPFPAVAIRQDTEDDRTDGTQHEHEGDTPGNFGVGLVEIFSQTGQRNRDGKEIEGIPSPAPEGNLLLISTVILTNIEARVDIHTKKNSHCCLFNNIKALKGLGALFIGGRKDVTRVAKYLPTVMFSSGKLEGLTSCEGSVYSFVSAMLVVVQLQ